MPDPLTVVTNYVASRMDDIAAQFIPGAKVTIIVRIPGNDEADFMLTSDRPEDLIRLLDRRIAAASRGKGVACV